MKRLRLRFISDPKVHDPGGALKTETEIISDHVLIKGMKDLIQGVIQQCVKRKGLVGTLILSSHGNSSLFVIGEERYAEGDKRLQALSVLRPFFAPDAYLVINACECGNAKELMRQVAKILSVTVIGYTGDIDVYKWFVFEGVVPTGNKVICTAGGCQEIDSMEELRKAFERGPGENVPGYGREA